MAGLEATNADHADSNSSFERTLYAAASNTILESVQKPYFGQSVRRLWFSRSIKYEFALRYAGGVDVHPPPTDILVHSFKSGLAAGRISFKRPDTKPRDLTYSRGPRGDDTRGPVAKVVSMTIVGVNHFIGFPPNPKLRVPAARCKGWLEPLVSLALNAGRADRRVECVLALLVLMTIGVPSNPNFSRIRLIKYRSPRSVARKNDERWRTQSPRRRKKCTFASCWLCVNWFNASLKRCAHRSGRDAGVESIGIQVCAVWPIHNTSSGWTLTLRNSDGSRRGAKTPSNRTSSSSATIPSTPSSIGFADGRGLKGSRKQHL